MFLESFRVADADMMLLLQRVTQAEPALVRELLSVDIVEDLNKVVQTSTDDFVLTNAKSILTLITTATAAQVE